jgi:hypothetical protein
MDAKSKRGCLWAAVGAAVLVIVVGAALFGGAAWLVYQGSSFQDVPATPERAGEELDTVLARFAGQAPLITIDEGERPTVTNRKKTSDAGLTALHVIAFDVHEQKMKRLTLPFWVLRLSPGELNIGGETLGTLRHTRLKVQDLEDAGPGLLLNHTDRSGTRIVVWTE